MALEIVPPVARELEEALADALAHALTDRAAAAWWRAGLLDATGADEDDRVYALSPRSTRGATRA